MTRAARNPPQQEEDSRFQFHALAEASNAHP